MSNLSLCQWVNSLCHDVCIRFFLFFTNLISNDILASISCVFSVRRDGCQGWCRQATSHHLSQCWPRSVSPCGVTRAQWFKQRTEAGETMNWIENGFIPTVLTHWGRDKMAATFQTIFSNPFSWMKMYKFRLRFHWSLFLRVESTVLHYWFR